MRQHCVTLCLVDLPVSLGTSLISAQRMCVLAGVLAGMATGVCCHAGE